MPRRLAASRQEEILSDGGSVVPGGGKLFPFLGYSSRPSSARPAYSLGRVLLCSALFKAKASRHLGWYRDGVGKMARRPRTWRPENGLLVCTRCTSPSS